MWTIFAISAGIVAIGLGRWIFKDHERIRVYRDRLEAAERETRPPR